jgi:hypothetical protein
MVSPLEQIFPSLLNSGYRITSPRSKQYNCIAWAVCDTDRWWWPGPDLDKEYWPPEIPRVLTLGAFQALFAAVGYEVCVGDGLEDGFEKVALFANEQTIPQHAARQLVTGRWTSNLGQWEDIEHALQALTGDVYGSVVLIMKRPVSSSST